MEGEFLLEGTNGSRPGDTESGKSPRHRKTNLPKAPVVDTSISAAGRLVVVVNNINLVTTFVTPTPR